jgi:hypothetical protein
MNTPAYVVVPTKNKQPIIKWTERRGIAATAGELQQWFGVATNPDVEGIGILLDASIVAIETDGIGENILNQKILQAFEAEGNRVIDFIADIDSADQIPVVVEPLFIGMGAHVEIHPVMSLDNLKKGIPHW